jgi:alpha-1,2-mannosyltransferase
VQARLTPGDRWWAIAGLVALAVALVAYQAPWGPRMIDLEVYRIGARALLAGTDLYTVAEPEADLPFTYPVFAAVVFLPLALLPELGARVLLVLLSLAALFLIVHLTVRYVGRATGRLAGSGLAWSVPLAVAGIAVHPVWETLNFGQVNLILAALVFVDTLTRWPGRWRGVLVGIATGIKLVPGVFILYFLVTGQRRAALAAALTTLGTIVVGFAVQPRPAWDFWTDHALNPERTGGIAYVTNQSFLGVSARLLRDPHPPRALTVVLGGLVLVAALALARRLYRTEQVLLSICVVAVASLLASPVSWSHHWVWAIPVLGTLVVWAARTEPAGRWRWWVFGVVAAIVVTAPLQFTPKEDLRELDHTLGQQVVANSYFLLAIAYLAWAAVRARGGGVTTPPASLRQVG